MEPHRDTPAGAALGEVGLVLCTHLTVEDIESGIMKRKELVELAIAAGVRVSDDSDRFERMLAKWRSREVRWDEDLGWPTGGAE